VWEKYTKAWEMVPHVQVDQKKGGTGRGGPAQRKSVITWNLTRSKNSIGDLGETGLKECEGFQGEVSHTKEKE